ncbi:hypothetical protein DBR32_02670 [Taibaiella sp. KBW10]|uniref:outer membrane beta-barrel protein n=1 Tax=Taibaiella sp. KBW10 TaxID=2153357 RepID=UPI000F594DEF|nr:outer membrane beta-barrel protein [Taibaiella sp. KBW10]RQO32522.1 hypothetical protein DBR32_02670 [Taibaiella sp. KBW10]
MKRLSFAWLIAFMVLLPATQASAQKPLIGVKIGANVYRTTGKQIDNDYKAYPFGGVYLGLQGDKMSLVAEGLFTQTRMITGNNFNDIYRAYIQNGKEQITHAEFDFTEFSVPVLVGFKLFTGTWLELGPQFTKIVNMKDRDMILTEVTNVYKNSYVSGVGGLRIQLPLHLNISARYIYGITNRNNTSVPERWSTQRIQFGIGFGF